MRAHRLGSRSSGGVVTVGDINAVTSRQPEQPTASRTLVLAPLGGEPANVREWFDQAAAALVPTYDGTLTTARAAAGAYARRAQAANTRRAYRAGVRAWCAWCDTHALPCLPAKAADVAAFLAAERLRGLSVNTITLRRAAIRTLHFFAGCAIPTAEAQVAATVAGIGREAADLGEIPAKKTAITVEILREVLAPIPNDLRGLRDRAMLLICFMGPLRRSELVRIRLEQMETRTRGLRLTLNTSKGSRGKPVTVAIPHGSAELCPVRALQQWIQAAAITEGPVFRRIWRPPTRGEGPLPSPVIGTEAVDDGTFARIVKARVAAAGYDPASFSGHSLKRGAITTGMDRGIHPTRLKKLARHKTYAVLDEYIEMGELFEDHPLAGSL
jgi:integrase